MRGGPRNFQLSVASHLPSVVETAVLSRKLLLEFAHLLVVVVLGVLSLPEELINLVLLILGLRLEGRLGLEGLVNLVLELAELVFLFENSRVLFP